MNKKPEDLVEKVIDEESFLRFIEALSQDWEAERAIEEKTPSPPYGSGALGWENGTIGAFLEAASACGFDNQSKGGILPGSNPWRSAAEILLAGKYYE
jgi:hypothetical protein